MNSLYDLHEWQETLMNKNDIDWTKADEAATYCDIEYRKFCDKNGYWNTFNNYRLVDHEGWGTDRYIARPLKAETKVYWDGKEDVKVGMWVQLIDGGREVEILLPADSEGDYIILDKNNAYGMTVEEYFTVIDTRTAREKAVAYMQYAYDKGNNMDDVLSEIIKGYVNDVGWVGDKS